jgi:GDP-4-dehydro-6-deoxy-D-mannose reductase
MARILVTGARGFVGQWLTAEFADAGYDVVELREGIDVRDAELVREAVAETEPDAVAHLAAVAFAPDAAADPREAFNVAVTGTINVMEAVRDVPSAPALLVTGSSEVYGSPAPNDLPLTERSVLTPGSPYAVGKAAQESVAIAYAARFGLRVIVTRSFNHIGPGQRPAFVVPAFARRIARVARGEADHVPVGDIDVRRDFSDVRDVVRAYRRLVDIALEREFGRGGAVVNVCSGKSVLIRSIAERLCELAGVDVPLVVNQDFVRPGVAAEIRGDYGLLADETGWRPEIDLSDTLAEIWREAAAEPANVAPSSGQ